MSLRSFALLILVCICFTGLPMPLHAGEGNHVPADVFDGMKKSFRPDKAKGVHARYLWNISGPHGGSWWIVVDDGKCEMGTGALDKPDVTFTVSDKDWVAIANDELSGSWAFVTGRLKIDGPQSIARKLDGMFP